jgi:hypothetical protein
MHVTQLGVIWLGLELGILGNCFIKVYYVYDFNRFWVFKYYVK